MAAPYLDLVSDDKTGAIYCIPLTTSNVAGCFYNKAVYEELGLEIPKTWDEFLEACEKIQTRFLFLPLTAMAQAPRFCSFPSITMYGMRIPVLQTSIPIRKQHFMSPKPI